MKRLLNAIPTIWSVITGIASIVSVIFLLFTNINYALIALIYVILVLSATLICIIWAISDFTKKANEEEYCKVSAFSKFEVIDDTHGILDTYRVIQSKRIILNQIDFHFKWTGSKQPTLTSEFQIVDKNIQENKNDYDKVVLRFKKPLLFNETGVVHFRAETDDYDKKAKPWLDFKVDTFISMIQFRAILRNKPNDYSASAKMLKRPINTNTPEDYEEFASVSFDQHSKSYEYCLIEPEIGYYYRLLWEK